MRKDFKPASYMYPQPVLMIGSYDENGVADVMNAAWGCISDYKQVAVYLDHRHKTVKNILKTKAFSVSMADEEHVVEADYVGVVSANDVCDKVEKAGLHVVKSEHINAPLFEEFALALECEMVSYDEESELMLGNIVNVSADERILNEEGKIDPFLLKPITYDPVGHTYISLGKKVGNAFKDGFKLKGE